MMDRNKEIFLRNISGQSQAFLSRKYHMSRSNVNAIVNQQKELIKDALNKSWYEKYQKVLSGINIEAELGSPWLTVSFNQYPGSKFHIIDNSANSHAEEVAVLAGVGEIALELQVRAK